MAKFPKSTELRMSGNLQQALMGKVFNLYEDGELTKIQKITESTLEKVCRSEYKKEVRQYHETKGAKNDAE